MPVKVRDVRVERARARDAAAARMQRLTFAGAAGATALVGLFAGVVAKAVPGRKAAPAVPPATAVPARAAPAAMPAPVPVESPAVPAPPAQPPSVSASQPVVVSGGS